MVEFIPAYPDEPPVYAFHKTLLSAPAQAELRDAVDGVIAENLGMPLVFTMHSTIKEWMDARNAAEKKAVETAFEEKKQREADLELVRLGCACSCARGHAHGR